MTRRRRRSGRANDEAGAASVTALGIVGAIVAVSIAAVPVLGVFVASQEAANAADDVIRDPMPTDGMVNAVLRAACYLVIGYSLALARISTKDG
jgi:ABC-2 type transport system permease protein